MNQQPEVIDAELIEPMQMASAIQLAPPEARRQLARQAFDSLPLERRHSDNFATLRQAVDNDPLAFLGLCQQHGLSIDLNLVYCPQEITNNYVTHHHSEGMTQDDFLAIMEAMQPQQQGLSAEEVLAIMQANQPQYQPVQSGLSAEDVWLMMESQRQEQQSYQDMMMAQMAMLAYQNQGGNSPPVHIEVSPHISSHSEQDNNPAGGFFLACLLVIFGVYAIALAGSE